MSMPMPTDMNIDEIRTQLSELETTKTELERALQERQRTHKRELAQEIRALIEEQGYDPDEIAALVMPKRRRNPRPSGPGYVRYADPDNPSNVYVRGPLPSWMKEKMTEKGYAPSSKDDREAFKAKHLNVLTN
jgi:DNA-binding protein H-NS